MRVQRTSDLIWAGKSDFAWTVRDTLDHYLTIANEHGFTRRKQLLDLLHGYPGRDALIARIREHGSDKWTEYLDHITASQDSAGQTVGADEKQDPADQE